MSISFSKKGKRTSGKNRAFLTAIALCCAAVALVAWSSALNNSSQSATDYKVEDFPVQDYTDSNIEWYNDESESVYHEEEPVPPSQSVSVEENLPEITQPVSIQTEYTDPAAVSVSAMVSTADTEVELAEVSYQLPISGGIICDFSGNDLVFSKTMCDWRVHQGIDIECAVGTSITSCGNGTVFDVIDDPMFGTTVIMDLSGGKTLYYCGLESSSVTVKKGQSVKAGDILGTVGVVPCESADGTHLHLALVKDGVYVDPIASLGIK